VKKRKVQDKTTKHQNAGATALTTSKIAPLMRSQQACKMESICPTKQWWILLKSQRFYLLCPA